MERYRLIIDGVNWDASHFAAMSEEDALKNMKKDGIEVPGKDDAEKEKYMKDVYGKLKEHVDEKSRKAATDDTKELKTVTKEMQQAQSAEQKAIGPDKK